VQSVWDREAIPDQEEEILNEILREPPEQNENQQDDVKIVVLKLKKNFAGHHHAGLNTLPLSFCSDLHGPVHSGCFACDTDDFSVGFGVVQSQGQLAAAIGYNLEPLGSNRNVLEYEPCRFRTGMGASLMNPSRALHRSL